MPDLHTVITWYPIDTAPKDGRVILLAMAHAGVASGQWHDDWGHMRVGIDPPLWTEFDHSGWEIEYQEPRWFRPTHWAPWPDNPEGWPAAFDPPS